MVYTPTDWVNVPDESNPPPGAPALSAEELDRMEQGIVDAHAHMAEVLAAHGGVLIYVGASTAPPASPPAGLLWHQTDGLKRDLRNIGTSAAPVWEDVTRDKLLAADLVTDYVVSGLLPAVPAPKSLTATIPAGQAYVIGRRVAKDAATQGFTANQDTYVDLDRDGVYRLTAVARGAAAPAVYANSIRLFMAATDASVAQVDTVDIVTVVNSTVYTVRINGVDVTYTSDATATEGEIALGLVAAVNASTDPNVSAVTAATSAVAADTAATLTITADVAGVPFTATVGANLTIANTTANNSAGITAVTDLRDTTPTVRGAGGGGAGHTIQDEGVALPARTNLNFVGASVAVTDDATNDQTDVTIAGVGSIDGVAPPAGGNVDLVAGSGVLITPDDTADAITIARRATGAFHAYGTTDQLDIASGVFTKINFPTEEFDLSAWYDAVTSVYTPQRAGYYSLGGFCQIKPVVTGSIVVLSLFKNGARYKDLSYQHTSSTKEINVGGTIPRVFANGTTDYFDIRIYHDFGVNTSDIIARQSSTWFAGGFEGVT